MFPACVKVPPQLQARGCKEDKTLPMAGMCPIFQGQALGQGFKEGLTLPSEHSLTNGE